MKYPKRKDYRKIIIREEGLLNSYSSVFLITSGLLLTAFEISDDATARLILSFLGLIITITWSLCTWQNWKVINELTHDYRKIYNINYLEEIVQNAMFKSGWRRPAFLISRVLPIIFLLTWLLFFILHMLRLFELLILF
jgi:hypothetical protein